MASESAKPGQPHTTPIVVLLLLKRGKCPERCTGGAGGGKEVAGFHRGELLVQSLVLPPTLALKQLQKWRVAWCGMWLGSTGGEEPVQGRALVTPCPGQSLSWVYN